VALHWAEPCRVLASHGSQRCRYRPLEGLTRRARSGAESLLLLTRQDGHKQHQGQSCVLQATDSGAQIGQMNARRVARSSDVLSIFQNQLN
jgi:hypothetical protein